MAVFTYSARDATGTLVQGDMNATTPTDVARQLRNEGKYVVKVVPKTGGGKSSAKTVVQGTKPLTLGAIGGSNAASPAVPRRRGGKYRADDLIFFTNQLAVLTETGVSLADALEACMHEGNSPAFAHALTDVIAKVEGGSEFSAALADHPRIFAPMYISLIKASEASGTMGPMLRRLATHLEAQRDMTKKIKGAVTYPIVMFVFAIGVTIFLMTFVLPKFANIYNGREDKLPKITKFLMAFSNFLMEQGIYWFAGLIVLAVAAFIYSRRTPKGRAYADALKLRLPMLGKLFHKTYLTRSLRTLGTMIGSGVSILDGVKLTSTVCGSLSYQKMWDEIHEKLQTGQQLSEALAEYRIIPKAVNKMLSSGERSGQLGPVMERVANFCDAELGVSIKTMTSMLEPAIVMFLGTVVGGLVLALLLPIFTISKAMH
jgi:type IV pilus assembly protein PilC